MLFLGRCIASRRVPLLKAFFMLSRAVPGTLLALCLAVVSIFFSFLPSPVSAQQATGERGVPFLTLRDRGEGDDPSDYFGEGRGTLTAGWCGITQTDLSFLAQAAEVAPFRIPEEILDVERVQELPVDTVASELEESAGGEALLYIHGYYIDFEKGCRRATVFKENSGLTGRFLWFSWPSHGSLLNYNRDEVDLYWSVPDLAEVISGMIDRFGQGNVDLAGHSLGSRGLVLALYEVASSRPDASVGEVVLLAPDMDFDIFRKLLPRISPIARSITVYRASSDKALAASEQLHGYPRLGQGNYDAALLGDVEVIDTAGLAFTSANGHLYHIYNKEVGEDVSQLVKDSKGAEARSNLEQIDGNLWRLLPHE